METEFWGVEVKNGEPLKVSPGYGMVLHLTQASLGEHKTEKGKESISLFINVDGKKLVLGTLITNKLPQHQFDILFDRDFELSHDWKSGSVYFYGYKASNSSWEETESEEGESDEYESEEDILHNLASNGKPESSPKQENPVSNPKQEKPESKAEQGKPESKAEDEKPDTKAKQEKPANAPNKESGADRDSVKTIETHKHVKPQEDDESSYEDMMSEGDGDDNSQVETSNKRPVESATVSKVPKKKAKVTRRETDGNKTVPLPGTDAVKTPADNSDKPTPKSGKPYPCKFCNKSFLTEQGVEEHTRVKHGDVK